MAAAADASSQLSSEPSFSRDVAPIILRHCATCHHPGPNSPFSLLTFADVRPRAQAIAAATTRRYMPPWKPVDGYGDELVGRRALTDRDIDTIQRWVAAGAPQGESAELPPAPQWTDGWRLGTPDVVIRMPDAYEVPASGPDLFRIFVLPIPTDVVRYVKAIEFMPGTRAVHHANLRLDETRTSRDLDAKDPAPGYDGLLARTAHFPDGYFFGWTPGQLTPPSEDLAWRLNPGTDLVLQLHMRPTGSAERVQAAIGLYFASGPPRLTPVMLRLGKQNIEIPAGKADYETTDSYVLPVDVDVHGVQPHAHYRAKEIKGFATLPDGTVKGLLYIRDWDFDWQDTYRYAQPFTLPKGTTLTMRYTYDNSERNRRNPELPPRAVHWGQNSSDEMGDFWIQVVPRSRSDVDLLVREFRQKVFREDILGYESMLARTPDDVTLHDDVALLYMAVGRRDAAVTHFSASARLAPDRAVTHFNLGTSLAASGQRDAAMAQYRQALQLDPDHAFAHNNLGSLLLATGALDEAAAHFRRAIAIDPRYAEAHNNLGRLLAYTGQTAEAIDQLSRALSINDSYAEAHYNLAGALAARGPVRDVLAHYRAAAALAPEWTPALTALGWMLATHPSDEVRDAREAIAVAERAVALTKRRDASALDTLAAAYAAGGRFDEAVATAQAAISVSAGPPADLLERLSLYRDRRAFVDARGSGPFAP